MGVSRTWRFAPPGTDVNPADQLTVPPARLSRRRLFAAACFGMAIFGMLIALLGTLFGLPEMRQRLAIDLAQQGELFGILSLGMLAASLASGPLLDRFGVKPVVTAGSAMVTAALAAFALSRGFAAAALAAALLGLGGAWLNIATNALVSDLFAEERGRMLNLLGVFFGVGALFVPALVASSDARLSVSGTIAVCAALAAACTAACALLRFPPAHEGSAFSLVEMLRTARHPGIWLFAILSFLQSGNETTVSGWTTTYIGSVGWPPLTATLVLLGYWVMAIGGRTLSATVQARVGKERLVFLSSATSVVGCLALVLAARWLPVLAAGAWLTALSFAAIYPTMLAMVGDRYPRFSGTVFGFLFSAGSVGNILFPLGMGYLSQAAGVRLGLLIPLTGAIGVTACAGVLARRK
jgi:MFS transporter, FHS family, glucose/mannose:H+ symporter